MLGIAPSFFLKIKKERKAGGLREEAEGRREI
jgi:hypothetical protein